MSQQYPTYADLVNKVAVVTGGSRGIGAAVSQAFAASGAQVVVNGRDQSAIDATVSAITQAGGRALGIAADSTDLAALERLRERIERELGPVSILVALAGGPQRPTPTLEVNEAEWQAILDGNLTATFLAAKCFLPGMAARGHGAIVTIATSGARLPMPGSPVAYTAGKASVIALTRQLAAEFGQRGVRANCIAPGTILTERIAGLMPPEQQRQLAATFPLRRLGTPADVAQAALFLAADASAWITGITLDVAGGKVML